MYSLHHVQEQFHKHAGTIPHCKNKRECLRKISVPYLFRYATGQQQVFTLVVHRCAAQRMTKNVYAIQKRMRPKSSALTSRARHSPHRAHYTGPPMDSFRSPMVSKYKVQKAGEKKKKRIVQADESKLVKYIYQPHIPTVGGLISMQVTSLG